MPSSKYPQFENRNISSSEHNFQIKQYIKKCTYFKFIDDLVRLTNSYKYLLINTNSYKEPSPRLTNSSQFNQDHSSFNS